MNVNPPGSTSTVKPPTSGPGGTWGMGGTWYNGPPPTKKPTAPKPPPIPTGSASSITATQADPTALADLQQILDGYGLGDLTQWAWGELVAGKSEAQVVLDLYQTPEFNQRFPGIGLRQQNGLPPISPSQYLAYEDSAIQVMKNAGLPAQYWTDPSTITKLIGQDVSLNELQQRVQMASQAAYQVPQAVRDALQRDYGIGAGQIAQTFLDADTPEPQLAQQFLAAQIGGAGTQAGYTTTRQIDERLAADGITPGQAQTGFTDLAAKAPLFTPLPGEQGYQGVDQGQQLSAEFEGNAAAQQQITFEQRRRVNQFNGSGGFAASSAGYSGLRAAQ